MVAASAAIFAFGASPESDAANMGSEMMNPGSALNGAEHGRYVECVTFSELAGK